MSIAPFKKVTLLGLWKSKNEILEAMQLLGCLHLIAINKTRKTDLTTPTTTVLEQLKTSIRYLKAAPEQGIPRMMWKEFTPDEVVQRVLANHKALQTYTDKREFLRQRIRDVSQLGQFNLPHESSLNGIKLWFYKLPLQEKDLIRDHFIVQELYRNDHYLFMVILSKEEPDYPKLAPFRIHTGAVSLQDLQSQLDEMNEQIENLSDERRSLTRFSYLLAEEVARFNDRTTLKKAGEKTLDHPEFFLLQGWAPRAKIAAMKAYCQQHQIGITIEDPCEGELPPTLLEPAPWCRGGSELVNFYQTPGYHSLDPSLTVYFSFALFFAMILADAGYGLIIALFTLFGWKRLGRAKIGEWLRPLLVVISVFSIAYGVLMGSYWGFEPQKGTLLAAFKIINIHDFKSMMTLVIVIGCIHICIGSGMRAWFTQHRNEKIQSIGFIILIGSALAYYLSKINHMPELSNVAKLFVFVSLLLIFLFADNEPVTGIKSLGKRFGKGFGALAELPSLFGDILSYLRLFALGLAGASLALTFNTIAEHISHKSWVLAVLVFLIGQSLNFILCLMSGVIHGLRLNYIEFFKWSVKEEGYGYQPLKKAGDRE